MREKDREWKRETENERERQRECERKAENERERQRMKERDRENARKRQRMKERDRENEKHVARKKGYNYQHNFRLIVQIISINSTVVVNSHHSQHRITIFMPCYYIM